MCEHRPQTANRFRRQPRSEHRHIAFEIAAHERPPPVKTHGVIGGEEALGEPAADPEPVDAADFRWQLENIYRREVQLRDPAGQCLRRLPHEIERRRP